MTTYNYTGDVQTYTVPDGALILKLEAWGAHGETNTHGTGRSGGRGGYAAGYLEVTPGEVLSVYVGGQSGWNGGGSSRTADGGDASDIRRGGTSLADRILVAPGGGGGGYDGTTGADGGGLTGGTAGGSNGGGGGTQSAGGLGQGGGYDGSLGEGGNGRSSSGVQAGGGGGGGYYGGAGGGASVDSNNYLRGGGGGGGSAYLDSSLIQATTTAGGNLDTLGMVRITVANTAPNAPTLVTMVGGGTVDRGNSQRARHTFSDDDPGDSQSAFDIRYRLVSDPAWTTVHVVSPNQWYDFPAGSLAVGGYERQVRTYDAIGNVGPYSSSGFFTAADSPSDLSITYPINGQQVEQDESVVWSAPVQDAYQVRRVADGSGSPDAGVIYFDSGEVANSSTRSLALNFATNGRPEHVQVRVKGNGLWSAWESVAVDVSYTPPPTPLMELGVDPATASLLVSITNPAPTPSEPDAVQNEVWVDDGSGEERRASDVPTNGIFRHWTRVSGRDYSNNVRVVAVADNGTKASSS